MRRLMVEFVLEGDEWAFMVAQAKAENIRPELWCRLLVMDHVWRELASARSVLEDIERARNEGLL